MKKAMALVVAIVMMGLSLRGLNYLSTKPFYLRHFGSPEIKAQLAASDRAFEASVKEALDKEAKLGRNLTDKEVDEIWFRNLDREPSSKVGM